jgi:chromosome segregation ATPase
MTKQITAKDLEEQNKSLENRVAHLTKSRQEEMEAKARAREELVEARRKVDRLQEELSEAKSQIIVLSRSVGILEGYKQRVEHVDDLQHGRPPLRSVDGCPPSGPSGMRRDAESYRR